MMLNNSRLLLQTASICRAVPQLINLRQCTYKSAISLDKLYPDTVDVKKFQPPTETGKFNGYIPIEDLVISYSRSSGPGGQHVNTTSTKVDVRFHVKTAKWLTHSQKDKLFQMHGNRISKDGYFIIRSEKTKVQSLNQADAVARLRETIFKLELPELTISPETEEKIRKNKEKATRMRLMEKRMRSEIKASRGL